MTPSGMFNHQLSHVVAELGAGRIIYSEDFPYVVRDNVTEFSSVQACRRPISMPSRTPTSKRCYASEDQ